jgi:LysR family transcriptional regulator, cell division regulator
MDAADLRVFEAVARLGGMNRAAAELNTVQSNVTARIRLIEDELGLKLFHRHTRGVALTLAGQRLLPYAGRVRQLLAEARRAVADDGTPRGPLAIGSLETTAGLRLPSLLAAYAEACPEVDLSLVTGTTAELVDAVLSRKIEGAFVCGPARHPDLDETPVFAEELVVVTGRNAGGIDELVGKSGLKIIVFRAGCSYRQILEAWLARRGIVGVRMLEFGTLEGILGCVAAGIGVSLLPEAIVAPAVRAGRIAIHRLAPAEARVGTVFIRRRDHDISSAFSTLLTHLPSLSLADAAE